MKGQRPLSVSKASELPLPVLPNRWQGEVNCIVGPFSSQTAAERFTNWGVDFGHYGDLIERAFASGNVWYVEVRPLKR